MRRARGLGIRSALLTWVALRASPCVAGLEEGIAWGQGARGLRCGLSASSRTIDVDGSARLFLWVENTGSRRALVGDGRRSVRLLVYHDGEPVPPHHTSDLPPRGVCVVQPGRRACIDVAFPATDVNLYSPGISYDLKPGRYRVVARWTTTQNDGETLKGPPLVLVSGHLDLVVTGTDEPRPQWVPTRPLTVEDRLPSR